MHAKTCPKCSVEKPLSEYWVRRTRKGKQPASRCKACFTQANPEVGNGEKPRQTEAQAAQVEYCKRLLMEGWSSAYLVGMGYAAGAIKQAKEQIT